MPEIRITDGATLRHKRIMDLLSYIRNNGGVSTQDCKGFMLALHGLKFDRTAEYLLECWMSKLITGTAERWEISDKGTGYLVGKGI